jgi:TctA family transporter
VDFQEVLLVFYFSIAGSSLGILSGLAPGIHVNTLAILLVSLYGPIQTSMSWICGPIGADTTLFPILISALIVSAAVVHSFVDFVPSVFLGAPDESQVLSVLPGHRLLLDGKGLDAIRSAAFGSLVGALVALILIVPLKFLMGPPISLYDLISPSIPFVLVSIMILLIISEREDAFVRALIDARDGSVDKCGFIVSIVPPIPINGDPVRMSGHMSHSWSHIKQLSNSFGTWEIRVKDPCPSGFVTVSGVWRTIRRRWRTKLLAASIMFISGTLGYVVLNARLPGHQLFCGFGDTPLFPLLTGLFGLPTLLFSLTPRRIPEQESSSTGKLEMLPALKGAAIGGFVGWFPGVTSTSGSVIGCLLSNDRGTDPHTSARRFITIVSSVGTSATVFSLAALAIIGKGRSGAMVAIKNIIGKDGTEALASPISPELSLLLFSVLISAAIGYVATLWLGGSLGRRLAGVDLRRYTFAIIGVLVVLSVVFNGIAGLLILGTSLLLGLIPPLVGVSRVHLTGCLLIPVAIFFFGFEPIILGLVGG